MKTTTILATIVGTLVSVSAVAQIQTIVTGPSETNSAVITVPTNSYAVFESVDTLSDADVVVTTQGAAFEFVPVIYSMSGFTFVGPATIQIQNLNPPRTLFASFEVVPLRKAVGTNFQTLVVSSENTNSATINVSSNSYAVINSGVALGGANLLINIQGNLFTNVMDSELPNNLTVAGPATIQLQATASYAPSFATVEVMPMRKSSRTQVQTLLVTAANTNSPTLTIPGSGTLATIAAANTQSHAVLSNSVQGVPFIYNLGFDVFTGFTFTGPATFQLQGDGAGASFVTVVATTPRK